MNENKESEEERQERLSDEEFVRTGVYTLNLDIKITVTHSDLIQDLVKNTEGKNIKAEKPNLN